jgi:hypothetical protein
MAREWDGSGGDWGVCVGGVGGRERERIKKKIQCKGSKDDRNDGGCATRTLYRFARQWLAPFKDN